MEDIIWSAGFIDGEGCIHIHKMTRKDKCYYGLVLHVYNTNHEAILKLRDTFKCGSIQEGKTSTDKSIWTYVATSAEAATILAKIKPYSIVKQMQIELALKFQSTVIYGGHIPEGYMEERQAYYELMKVLK